MTRAAYILNGARTPFTKIGTDLKAVSATDLGRAAAVEAMARSHVEPGEIDQAIFGNIATPPDAANIGRVIALRAGIPKERPAHSVARNCASGIESIVQAARLIQTGEADVVLAGGVENMTLIPFIYRERAKAALAEIGMARTTGARIAAFKKMPWSELLNPVIGLKLGLTDPVCGLNMGETAELLAKEGGITREMQDAFALRSHQRALAARDRLAEEIVAVPLPPAFDKVAALDNGVREGQSIEALAKLKPFFDRVYGSVTAGNSSQITDGGAAVVVASEEFVAKRKLPVLGRIAGWGFAGLEPERMGLGPSRSTPVALKHAGVPVREDRSPRAERGVRGPGPGEPPGLGEGPRPRRGRPGDPERERRRHRPRPPGRGLGDAPRPDAPDGDAAPEGLAWRRDALHRRRPGGFDRPRRGGVMSATYRKRIPSRRRARRPRHPHVRLSGRAGEQVQHAGHDRAGGRPRRPREEKRRQGAPPRLGQARHLHRRGRRERDREGLPGPRSIANGVRQGQAIFGKLANLPFPTVAAVEGACVGGGCETILAMDWRLASDSKKTQIGLPEIKLGILPAWGGTTRLPRVVGLTAALDVILAGKVIDSKRAKKMGLVDQLVPAPILLDAAKKFARGKFGTKKRANAAPDGGPLRVGPREGDGQAPRRGRPLRRLPEGPRVGDEGDPRELPGSARGARRGGEGLRPAARRGAEAGGRRDLPPRRHAGDEEPREPLLPDGGGQEGDRRGGGRLAALPVKRIGVLGAGAMGGGIAQLAADKGWPVRMKDIRHEALAAG